MGIAHDDDEIKFNAQVPKSLFMLCHFVMHGTNVDEVQRVNVYLNRVHVLFSKLAFWCIYRYPACQLRVQCTQSCPSDMAPATSAHCQNCWLAMCLGSSTVCHQTAMLRPNQKLLRIRGRPRSRRKRESPSLHRRFRGFR
jgi:hypothetical protein